MTPEQFLAHTAALDWSTAEAIGTYLDSLGLWPEHTPMAQKMSDVAWGLSATDSTGWPLVARLRRDGDAWLYKQETSFTASDYTEVIGYAVAQVQHHQQRAVEARDAAVQQGEAHMLLPWEEPVRWSGANEPACG